MRLLHHGGAAEAGRRPEATAVVFGNRRLSFGELEQQSNRLAWALRELGCAKGDRVCLLMPKGPAAIVAIQGTLKTGASYVPLDVANPASRLARMVRACRPRALLSCGRYGPLVDQVRRLADLESDLKVGWMNHDLSPNARVSPCFRLDDLESMPASPLADVAASEDAAYVMFTSGSTGFPKGVVITHANALAFLDWALAYFGLSASDRISGHPPLHFDLSVFDVFGALSAGAELHLLPPDLSLLPHKLAAYIQRSGLTQWFSVPSVLNYLAKFDAVEFNDFPRLKRLLWCGEVLPTATLIHWMERLPHVTFTNLYGPTETTIASSYYTVPSCPGDPRQSIPIGRPCGGETLHVLDASLRPVPTGEVGELFIGGSGLSPGYWDDPGRTREMFVQLLDGEKGQDRLYRTGDLASVDEQGIVWFHGRVDSQIKSRGHRIELGEIETAVQALDGLKESAVVALDTGGFEGKSIGCAFSPMTGSAPRPAELRRQLSKHLPSYMLPSRWLQLDSLPRNANGKIDRGRLRKLLEVRDA